MLCSHSKGELIKSIILWVSSQAPIYLTISKNNQIPRMFQNISFEQTLIYTGLSLMMYAIIPVTSLWLYPTLMPVKHVPWTPFQYKPLTPGDIKTHFSKFPNTPSGILYNLCYLTNSALTFSCMTPLSGPWTQHKSYIQLSTINPRVNGKLWWRFQFICYMFSFLKKITITYFKNKSKNIYHKMIKHTREIHVLIAFS